MNLRVLFVFVVLLLMALLAGLWWRRGKEEAPLEAGTALQPAEAPARAEAQAPDAEPADASAPAGPPRKLHGLRLITTETAVSRGWKAPPPDPADADPVHVARKRWHLTEVEFLSNGRTVAEVLAEIEEKYGLHVRIDPLISLEGRTLTMKVNGMSGDETMKFIAKFAKDMAFAIDVAGEAWLTTPERALALEAPPEPPSTDPNRMTASCIRWKIRLAKERAEEKPRPPLEVPWKGQKVTVAIVRKSLEEAFQELGVALNLRKGWKVAVFDKEAGAIAAAAQPVSLVATDMPVEQAIDELLRGTGLVMETEDSQIGRIRTAAKVEEKRVLEATIRKQREDEAAETAALRLRTVRISGEILTASDVVAQVGGQLGITVRTGSEIALCPAFWESDGLEQTAGEVLDILAHDGELIWKWQGTAGEVWDLLEGPRCLWVVGAVEK